MNEMERKLPMTLPGMDLVWKDFRKMFEDVFNKGYICGLEDVMKGIMRRMRAEVQK